MLITCVAVMVVAAIQKDGKLLGKKVCGSETESTAVSSDTVAADVMTTLEDGTVVVNTTELCKDVDGYAGPVPMQIKIKDGKVTDIEALPNDETPDFFDEARVIVAKWKDKSLDEAAVLNVDVVTGATFSSNAIIKNVRAGLAYAAENLGGDDELSAAFQGGNMDMSAKSIIGLIVVLMAAVIPFFFKNKIWRTIQMLLNVGILGFWCGSFLNYTFFLHALSNGLDLWAAIIPIIMLVTAFVYPLFGKKGWYCANVCPFGSLQDLAGKASKKKLRLSKGTLNFLNWFRRILWVVLMLLMVAGLWFDWMNYELFTAFIFNAASWVVIAVAVVCLLLSIFIPRPYCRFVCPTGSLMKTAEGRF